MRALQKWTRLVAAVLLIAFALVADCSAAVAAQGQGEGTVVTIAPPQQLLELGTDVISNSCYALLFVLAWWALVLLLVALMSKIDFPRRLALDTLLRYRSWADSASSTAWLVGLIGTFRGTCVALRAEGDRDAMLAGVSYALDTSAIAAVISLFYLAAIALFPAPPREQIARSEQDGSPRKSQRRRAPVNWSSEEIIL